MSFRAAPAAILLLLLTCASHTLAEPPAVDSWEIYRATTQPQFRMAFPGPVREQESEVGYTYSGHVKPADDLALQVIVQATRREVSAAEMDPEETLAIFTSEPEGEVTSKEIVKDGNGFSLVFSTESIEEGLIVVSQHHVHFLGFNVYQVSYAVVAEEGISQTRLREAVDLGRQVLEKFRAG